MTNKTVRSRKRNKSKAVLTIRFALLLSPEDYAHLLDLAAQSQSGAGAVLRHMLRDTIALESPLPK